ncbi:hypothetical protein FLA_5523 [Filimonas lacunae]|nr:hypothetical protein FLA_5523 [Filimonas lacunae]
MVTTSYAQIQKKQGLVVLNNGDTLYGWINYKAWRKNPKSFTFYSDSATGKSVTYTVNDVHYLEITGFDIYKKAIVTKDLRPVDMNSLLPIEQEAIQKDTVLLRALLLGKKLNLYELNEDKLHLYTEADPDVFTLLEYKMGLNSNGQVVTLPIYKDQLNGLATRFASEGAKEMIESTEYAERDIKKVIATINNDQLQYAYKRPRGRLFSFFIGGGLASGKINMAGKMSNVQLSRNTTGTVEAGVNIYAVRSLQDLVFRFDVSYLPYNYTSTMSDAADYFKYDYYLKGSDTRLSLSLLYNVFRREKCKIYAGIGGAYNLISLKKNEMHQRATGLETTVINDYFKVGSNWTSCHFRVGVLLMKRFELYVNSVFTGVYAEGNEYSMSPRYSSANFCIHL